jgi:ribosomal protein S27E
MMDFKFLVHSTRFTRLNQQRCSKCESTRLIYRKLTKDLRCKHCGTINKIKKGEQNGNTKKDK